MKRKLCISAAASLPVSLLVLGSAHAQPPRAAVPATAPVLSPSRAVQVANEASGYVITIVVTPSELALTRDERAEAASRLRSLDD